jgi:small subunit ribosomal protein S5
MKPRVKKKNELESRVLDLSRVTRVSAGGRRLRFRAVIAVGDQKGRLGLGVAKGLSVREAINKARRTAEKKMIKVEIKEGTIFCSVTGKAGASEVLFRPKSGQGLSAGATVRTLCQLAGIQSLSAKVLSRSKNSLNIARATLDAFQQLKDYATKSAKIQEAASK